MLIIALVVLRHIIVSKILIKLEYNTYIFRTIKTLYTIKNSQVELSEKV
jgi:hypothetical protein